ncbi:uncharacterized protein BDZ99DRAFT_526411 [Mytilinidion resinicola]|uniref:LIM-domain-containing protein n=1 Tax=Mytilinidion resinicola TaxID=574789 RepID=A0A6A6Y3X7_9PEZI|nr:uncharacterized protein BDZ99DRAFT_526411 [Mytilinidion resinicola]KAF2803482.1 hypothetical protein BDZ99DRAFT_526411 [Mytilinidion resinicola]
MMATGYPQHPGGPQHLGMPHAQQMGPGGPNPGQHLGQAMQMHPGVSGSNGPHVSQAGAMMPGMQQGVGPNAHALSHLTPQPHMFPQQQQQMQMNPALVQQQQNQAQQQAFLRQRQQQQQMAFQQQNGIGMGFPGGMNPQMSAQVAAMQGNPPGNFPINRVDLPPHMQQQLLQQRQMQQQQAQAHAQAQAQAQQQAVSQQQQQQQMHQHLAMQHAQSQSSNPGQQGPQGPQTSQPQQGPLRPPSQMSVHEGHSSPAPPPNPQQSQPPQAQPPQAPNQPPNLQQQNSQQQHPQNAQQMQRPQQPLNQQQVAVQAMMRRQQEARQQQGQGQAGQTILKLLLFLDHLSRFSTTRQENNISHWNAFVSKFFSPEGEFKHTLYDRSGGKTKQFPVSFAALPRYFYVQFDSGVENMQITIDGASEKAVGTDSNYVESHRAKIIYSFQNGTQLVAPGKLSAIYSQSNQQNEPKLDLLSFETSEHQEYIPRKTLERLFTQPSPSQLSQTQSPRMTNKPNAKQRNQQRQLQKPDVPPEPFLNLSDLPQAPIDDFGVTAKTLQYLEIGETFSHMNQLILYAQDHPELTPAGALNSLLASLPPKQFSQQPSQQQQGNIPPNQAQLLQQQQQQNLPPGSRTPSGTGQAGGPNHQFMSPAMANLGLPGAINGSPHLMQNSHTPSPAQTHMAKQHSQQGTNSSATASANTSPNVSNKRRRSNVKMETDDGGGGEVNGAGGGQKVKASPRVGGNKRVKGNG